VLVRMYVMYSRPEKVPTIKPLGHLNHDVRDVRVESIFNANTY